MTKYFSLLLVALSLLFVACKKDNNNPTSNNSTSEGVIKAKVDGVLVETLAMTGTANLVENVGTLTIQGNTGGTNSEAFSMIINGYDGVGDYAIGDNNNIVISASYTKTNIDLGNIGSPSTQVWQAPYANAGEVGSISITKMTNDQIEGTFNFSAQNNKDQSIKNITEGSFKLKLTKK